MDSHTLGLLSDSLYVGGGRAFYQSTVKLMIQLSLGNLAWDHWNVTCLLPRITGDLKIASLSFLYIKSAIAGDQTRET